LRGFPRHAHSRSPIDFRKDQLDEAKRSYQRLVDSLETAKQFLPRAGSGETDSGKRLVESAEKAEKQFEEVMDDDFNTREAISLLFELARELNVAVEKSADKDSVERGLGTFTKLAGVLGLFPERGAETEAVNRILELIMEIREKARSKKDYETADWIRSELEKLGIRLEDTGKGVVKKAR